MADAQPTVVTYRNTAEDFTQYNATYTTYFRWLRRAPVLAIAALLLLLLDNFVRGTPPQRKVLYPVFAVALLSSLWRDSEERRFRQLFRVALSEAPQRVEISPAGMRVGFPPDQTCWDWAEIDRLEADDYSLYVFWREQTPDGEFLVIPRRVFRTPWAADSFLRLARGCRTAAASSAVRASRSTEG